MKTQTEEDELIPEEPWHKYIENYQIHRSKQQYADYEFIQLTRFEQSVKALTKGIKPNPDQGALIHKTKCLLYKLKKDLYQIFSDEHELTLQSATIIILETIEDYPYFFNDNVLVFIEMLTCLTLKECSLVILINSIFLKELIKKMIKELFLNAIQYNDICETLFYLIVMMIAHLDFINNPDLELIQLLVDCFKYYQSQRDLTVKEREIYEHKKKFEKKMTRKQAAAEKEEQLPEEKYLQVPFETQRILKIGLILIPQNICQMPSSYKYQQSENILKESNPSIFLLTLSFKIKQTLIDVIKQNKKEFEVMEMLLNQAETPECYSQQRECLKTVLMFLEGFDETLLWIKFDSSNFFDNSNFNNVLIYGDPTKLNNEQGLFYDGCGGFFDQNQVLHLEEPLIIPEKQISISFWMVMFNPETSKTKGAQNNYQIRTLLGSSDGYTSLILCDSFSQLFGITNVSDEEYGYKFFDQKQADRNLTGWNHVVIVIDNSSQAAYLYLNGNYESQLNKIQCKFDIKFIGNSGSLDQPIGYVCDLRIYCRILNENEIKKLSNYDKKQVVLEEIDLLEQIISNRTIIDLKRLLTVLSTKNMEGLVYLLQIFCRLCQATTIFRLECAKYGIFDMAMALLPSSNKFVSYHAAQLINNMK